MSLTIDQINALQAENKRLRQAMNSALRQKTSAACICTPPLTKGSACRECAWSGYLEVALAEQGDADDPS